MRALAELGPRYAVDPDLAVPFAERLDAAFGRSAHRIIDVGIGNGAATIGWAEDHPQCDILAVELHRPSVAQALVALDESGLTNVRIVEQDVRTLVAEANPGAVHGMRILFPDPWPKRRHHARRLIDEAFVGQVGDMLPVGAMLQVATDWPDYAEQVIRCAEADGRFDVHPDVERPRRPETTYEALGRAAGRPITDVVAVRR